MTGAIADVQLVALESRLASIDWNAVGVSLDAHGFASLPAVLEPSACAALIDMYGQDALFRNRVVMAAHRFGEGEYQYFAAPLPPMVATLRERLYPPLAAVANAWMARLDAPQRYPDALQPFLDRCHEAGQRRPTPLMLTYEAGGYNCLHQDLYGEVAFPLQVVFALSPDAAYTGGEFLLVEQRPRAQSRGHVLRMGQGAGIVFATRERPVSGTRGVYRTILRHGVATVISGRRVTLGVIFHDAK